MLLLPFAWLSAAAFAASLGFFLYSYLVRFGAAPSTPADSAAVPAAVNVLMFSAFALHHSVFARTGLKRAMSTIVGPAAERSVYSFIASVLFVAVCWWWQPVPGVLYELTGPWRWLGGAAVAAGLVVTAVGARALDVWELAGVRQALDAQRRSNAPRRPLETGGIYAFVRHPLYFGWALIVFGAPQMSMTRFTFAVISTLYLVVAIPFEERSLIETFGPDYASYRKKVRWRMMPGIY